MLRPWKIVFGVFGVALMAAACGNEPLTIGSGECGTTVNRPVYAEVRPETWKKLTPERKKLHEMFAKYGRSLDDIPGVLGLAIGDGVINVIVLSGAEVDRERIPSAFEGCEVEIIERGKATDL